MAVRLKKLVAQNFKNHIDFALQFEKPVVALLGNNGSGKTNILDAIHYLAFTKSALNNTDSQNIRSGQNYFFLEGEFEKDGRESSIRCTFDGKKKRVFEAGSEYSRFSEHIGKYPVVMIAPQDISLVWEGGDGRRRFFDQWFGQANRHYLEALVAYAQLLKQRNSLLRMAQQTKGLDFTLLETYHSQMVPAAEAIYQTRKTMAQAMIPLLQREYKALVEAPEQVTLAYQSHLDEKSPFEILTQNLGQEVAAGRTLAGIHLDEYQFLLNGFEVRKYGSQGQQKSFLIALKWAEISYFGEKTGFYPIVLLDDIFDKMDDQRITRLMEMLAGAKDAQYFITDANPSRATGILKSTGLDCQAFKLESEKIVPF